jgi:hypothetical protein
VARSDAERLRQHRILMPEVGIPLPKREGEPTFHPRRPRRQDASDRRGQRSDRPRRPYSPDSGRASGPRSAAPDVSRGGGRFGGDRPGFNKSPFKNSGPGKPDPNKSGYKKPCSGNPGGFNKPPGFGRGGSPRGRRPGPRGGGGDAP